MTDEIPLVLKYHNWPEVDKVAWKSLFSEGDIFDDTGPFYRWSEGSRTKRMQSYGQWLSFLMRCDPDAFVSQPGDRVTQRRVEQYLEECKVRLKPSTISNLVGDLSTIVKAIAPHREFGWLRIAAKRLMSHASKNSAPEAPPISAGKIFRWSINRLHELEADDTLSELRKASRFRLALMIGFLIARPVRRRTLLCMMVETHLLRIGDAFHLQFAAEDMKDNKARTMPLPDALNAPMARYLAIYRPILLGGNISQSLWISKYGEPITPDGLARDLPEATKRHLGVELRPHMFRHIAATSIAEIDPGHVNIIRDILGHATLDMAQKHYNRAGGITSCNKLQSIMEDIREDMPKMGRAKTRRSPVEGRRKAKRRKAP